MWSLCESRSFVIRRIGADELGVLERAAGGGRNYVIRGRECEAVNRRQRQPQRRLPPSIEASVRVWFHEPAHAPSAVVPEDVDAERGRFVIIVVEPGVEVAGIELEPVLVPVELLCLAALVGIVIIVRMVR